MHTASALVDIHERTHRCVATLLEHCGDLDPAALHRELPGFGSATVQLQFHHGIGAQRYWIGVLQGRIDVEDDAASYPTVAGLQEFRARIFEMTERCIQAQSTDELNAARPMTTWGNKERLLVPAQVILRTQTHLFHHLGQIAAMCRLLGKPSKGSDYPLG